MNETQTQPQGNEEELKMLADLKLENQSLREENERLKNPTADIDRGEPLNEVTEPQTDRGFETLENLTQMGGTGDTAGSPELAEIRKEIETIKRENEVHRYAEEYNVTAEGKKILMEGVIEKGMSIEDASIYAQGKMMNQSSQAVGTPTPGQSEHQINQQEQAAEKAANPSPQDMSTEELEKQASADFEQAYQQGQSIKG